MGRSFDKYDAISFVIIGIMAFIVSYLLYSFFFVNNTEKKNNKKERLGWLLFLKKHWGWLLLLAAVILMAIVWDIKIMNPHMIAVKNENKRIRGV